MKRLFVVALGLLALPALSMAASVKLSWDDYVPGSTPAISFHVKRQVGCEGSFSQIANVAPVSKHDYTDTTVTPGQRYCYQVVAVDSAGDESQVGNTFSIQVPPALTGVNNLKGLALP